MDSPVESFTVGTWFVADGRDTATQFPSTGKDSSAPEIQAVYWRCVGVFFALAAKTNPNWNLIFYTNVDDLPRIDGINIQDVMDLYKVEVVRLPITYRLPPGAVSEWGNQFYILDIIKHAAERHFPRFMMLDSDVVFTRPAPEIAKKLDLEGALTLRIGYEEDKIVNGSTRWQLLELSKRYLEETGRASQTPQTPPVYCGGEFFCVNDKQCGRIAAELPGLWAETIRRAWEPGGVKEEAHFLSIIYQINGYTPGSGDDVIKRMWTSFKFNNIVNADLALPIWHLPSEKKFGFMRLFRRIFHQSALEKLDGPDALIRLLQAQMGVPRHTPVKFVLDGVAKVKSRLAR